MSLLYLYFLFEVYILSSKAVEFIKSERFIRYEKNGYQCVGGSSISTKVTASRSGCASYCLSRDCGAFNFRSSKGICETFSGNVHNELYYDAGCEAFQTMNQSEFEKSYKRCPLPFTYVNETSSCFYLGTDKSKWPIAQAKCNALKPNSHLVIIQNATKWSRIYSYLSSIHNDIIAPSCILYGHVLIWTSGQRLNPPTSLDFYWKPYPSNSTWTKVNYTRWQSGEPSDPGTGIEGCLNFYTATYDWNDIGCSDDPYVSQQCYLCEFDM